MNSIAIIKRFFLLLSYPKYWFYSSSYPYCQEFDEWVIQKIKDGEVPSYKDGSDCTVDFAGRTLWKWCFGGSDFKLFEPGYDEVRASRMTNIKLDKLLKENKKPKVYNWKKGNE